MDKLGKTIYVAYAKQIDVIKYKHRLDASNFFNNILNYSLIVIFVFQVIYFVELLQNAGVL